MLNHKKAAFTMLELVMVIVVLGILAALAMPRMERDLRQEAADNVLSAIRYTQHLALMDNKTDSTTTNWQSAYWHLRFEKYNGAKPKWFYAVSSSNDGDNNIDNDEVAVDPANGLRMNNTNSANGSEPTDSPSVFIGENYGVNSVVLTGGCAATGDQHIAFDHLGRPHVGVYSATNDFGSYMSTNCTLTLGFEDTSINNVSITIVSETGHAFIVGQPNS